MIEQKDPGWGFKSLVSLTLTPPFPLSSSLWDWEHERRNLKYFKGKKKSIEWDLGFTKIHKKTREKGEEEYMEMDSVPSNSHGNLDEQISQLMQCKPLSEQEVLLLLLFSFLLIYHYNYCHYHPSNYHYFYFCPDLWNLSSNRFLGIDLLLFVTNVTKLDLIFCDLVVFFSQFSRDTECLLY